MEASKRRGEGSLKGKRGKAVRGDDFAMLKGTLEGKEEEKKQNEAKVFFFPFLECRELRRLGGRELTRLVTEKRKERSCFGAECDKEWLIRKEFREVVLLFLLVSKREVCCEFQKRKVRVCHPCILHGFS